MFNYQQFMLWTPVPQGDHIDKVPCNPHTGVKADAHCPDNWTDFYTARTAASRYPGYGVAFVFTAGDPFFFMDLDGQLQDDGTWSPLAVELCQAFAGCAVEVSQSGRGLHIFGTGSTPLDSYRNKALGIELYTNKRFVALTLNHWSGDANHPAQPALNSLLTGYLNQADKPAATPAEWTTGPDPEWSGPDSDEELLARMLASKGGIFGNSASIQDLWVANAETLGQFYPDNQREFDHNRADSALCSHLAFWTGKDCDRIDRLFRLSGLMRDKWEDRGDYYRHRTILGALSYCKSVYHQGGRAAVQDGGLAEGDTEPGGCLGVGEQPAYFEGCVYVRDLDKIMDPSGALLKQGQFKVMYGGHNFALDAANAKYTTDAWKVFTESQAIRFPKVFSVTFRPEDPPGSITSIDGHSVVNIYVPIQTPREVGDAGPFIRHLEKLFPTESDRNIILSYVAACVQYPGFKFQWCPLIQGVEGNGKTLIINCVGEAIGWKHTHLPNSADLGNKFNGWLLGKRFAGIEEVFTTDKREVREALKKLVTNDKIEVQGKGADQVLGDNRANFIMCSNHKDAVVKTLRDRRFAIFYTAQQDDGDLERDGMGGMYFPNLYKWLKHESGYAIVNDYLRSYGIPDELNPAGSCHRAPRTSSTGEALYVSLGPVDQEVLEAIDQETPGFCGGWVSSIAMNRLMLGVRKISHHKRGEVLCNLGYIKHPGLHKGRSGKIVAAEGGRPCLYVLKTSKHINLSDQEGITLAYLKAQGYS